jgi:hypothetical protein
MLWYQDFSHKRHAKWVQEYCNQADIIFVQRNLLYSELWDACDYWRGLGKIVVGDLDDSYPMLPVTNPAWEFWIKNGQGIEPDPIERLTEGLQHVDALTSPSKVILDDWKHVVPGIWIPNLASTSWWLETESREDDGRIVLGWGGSVSHYDSFWDSGIREALKVITREYNNVYLMICGNDKRLRHKAPAPKEKTYFQTGVAPWLWPQIVAKFDIGLAPLAGDYDRRRSWIKVMEYALAGIPCAFTDYEPYSDLRPLGIPVTNSPENWYKALKFLIENIEDVKKDAQARQQIAIQDLTIMPNIDRYVNLFNQVIPRTNVTVPGIEKI